MGVEDFFIGGGGVENFSYGGQKFGGGSNILGWGHKFWGGLKFGVV